ncbi:helix-turn-helix domain-containing protein [Stappia sp. BW2]|uniref:helix-turn-helix transcriptional regulator n=1 Tax=Stappia sp. BW2 TaxID=2592622 RepID=UPI0011DE6F6E|nr:helix-turn-helix transcriptional regulator [Stappia sp. BW2]TYC79840.1 helix-turn-helix domain-containing protein [Stappia sp. BW2]
MGDALQDTGTQHLQFLTTKEVADLLRVKERKVYDLAAANEIPHRRITGKLLFPAAELRSWIEGPTAANARERPGVLAGSHDPLLDWAVHASGCGLAMLCNGSADGLNRFAAGDAALAGLHLPEETGWNVESVSRLNTKEAVLIGWAKRQRGLLVSREAATTIRSVADLKGKRVAMRQPGTGTALLFSRLLAEAGLSEADLTLGPSTAHTENDAASAVAAGEAEAALGIETAARPFKLAFVPLAEECFDLLIDRRSYFTPPVQKLFEFARTPEFQGKAAALGGYDLDGHGAVRWLSA